MMRVLTLQHSSRRRASRKCFSHLVQRSTRLSIIDVFAQRAPRARSFFLSSAGKVSVLMIIPFRSVPCRYNRRCRRVRIGRARFEPSRSTHPRDPGFIAGVLPFHWAQVVNIKRDPFETSIGTQYKTLMGMGGWNRFPFHRLHLRLEHAGGAARQHGTWRR